MEIKVKELGSVEAKSVQEIEGELLAKHEQSISEGNESPQPAMGEVQNNEAPVQLSDEEVLSFIKNRYNREINSVDELFSAREEATELPEDVSSYLKYKKETGRGIKDFIKLNEEIDESDPQSLLAQYYAQTESDLDSEDIQFMIDERFSYDEDLDDESDVKRKKLAIKKELAKAKKFFEEEREKYRAPLESSGMATSAEDQEASKAYKEYMAQAQSVQEENQKRYEWFQQKTSEVFGDGFKGFEFAVNDKTLVYSPAEAAELKKSQSDIMNFIGKFANEDGLIEDAKGYHKALAVAMNPERFAKFFYEQGMSAAVDDVTRKSKNINMDIRQSPQNISKGGMNVKSLSNDSGRGLKIRSNK
jgi:hypothetical protein